MAVEILTGVCAISRCIVVMREQAGIGVNSLAWCGGGYRAWQLAGAEVAAPGDCLRLPASRSFSCQRT